MTTRRRFLAASGATLAGAALPRPIQATFRTASAPSRLQAVLDEVRTYSGSGRDSSSPTMTSDLIPLGDDRFLPTDPAMGGNRGWDVAFWGKDDRGRATHFLNGVFAMRRAQ